MSQYRCFGTIREADRFQFGYFPNNTILLSSESIKSGLFKVVV